MLERRRARWHLVYCTYNICAPNLYELQCRISLTLCLHHFLLQSEEFADIRSRRGQCENCTPTEKSSLTEKDAPTCSCSCSSSENKGKRREYVHGVLAQQWEHQKLGINDPKGLFQFSKSLSKGSRQKAIRQAKEDAEEVKAISKESIQEVLDSALDMLSLNDFS